MEDVRDQIDDPLIDAVRAAAAGGKVQRIGTRERAPAPIRGVSGAVYDGIGAFDTADVTAATDLVLLTAEDLEEQGYSKSTVRALLAHRTRKLNDAMRAGTFTDEQLAAMADAGYIDRSVG